jgi:diaminopimelate epimerase
MLLLPGKARATTASKEDGMNIDFVKMEGAGNDYVYLDLISDSYDVDYGDLARRISDRHFGVGGDGLVLIMQSDIADYKMRMLNADGSEAEMCGNAIRCVGKYLYDHRYLTAANLSIETLAGIKGLSIVETDEHGRATQLRVNMGEPMLNGKDIPVSFDMEPVIDVEVRGYRGTAVSMGNPHFVIFLDEVNDNHVLLDGPRLEVAPEFPKRINVEFNRVLDRENMEMRVWERGSGETLACGTGACASAVAAVLNNFTSRRVAVKLLGGTLVIEWDEESNAVYMTGPATQVFAGVYNFTL